MIILKHSTETSHWHPSISFSWNSESVICKKQDISFLNTMQFSLLAIWKLNRKPCKIPGYKQQEEWCNNWKDTMKIALETFQTSGFLKLCNSVSINNFEWWEMPASNWRFTVIWNWSTYNIACIIFILNKGIMKPDKLFMLSDNWKFILLKIW